ncbi:MAG TPA: hypothetical protein VF940_32580 [Streptosporangiaceae bacterium]
MKTGSLDVITLEVAVYDRHELVPGTTIAGPALFEEREPSCCVGPDCMVTVDSRRNLIIDIDTGVLRDRC